MGLFKNKPFALCAFFFIIALSVGLLCREVVLPSAILCVIIFFLALVSKRKTLPLVCIFVFFGLFEAFLFEQSLDENVRCLIGREADVKAVVTEKGYVSDYYSSYIVHIKEVDGRKSDIKAEIQLQSKLELERKNEISAHFKFSDFDTNDDFNEKEYKNSKNVYLCVDEVSSCDVINTEAKSIESFFADIKESLSSIFDRFLNRDTSGFIKAVFLGDRSDLGDAVKRDFKRTGIYHVLALSGMHLSILTSTLSLIFEFFGFDKRIKYLILLCLMCFYVFMTGCALSTVRSMIMLGTTYLAYFFRRERDSLSSLSFAAMLVCAVSPSSVFDVGFQLSVVATFGIVISTPLCEKVIAFIGARTNNGGVRKLLCVFASSLITSVAATLMTLPFSLFVFGKISTVGVPMTMLVSPMITFILTVSPFVLLFKLPFIADILDFVTDLLVSLVSYVSDKRGIFISLDYGFARYAIPIFFAVFAFLLVVELRHKCIVPIVSVVFLSAFFIFDLAFIHGSDTEVRYIRDGKNEYFIMSNSGANVLIDISDGSYSHFYDAVTDAAKYGFCEVDALILTHLHQKHIVTFSRMSKREKIRTLVIPRPENSSQRFIALELIDIAEQNGLNAVISENGSEITLFESEKLLFDSYFLNRSTHPCLSFSAHGDIELAYYGSSYLEKITTDKIYEHTFFGMHGPIAKNDYLPVKCRNFVSVADESLVSFLDIENYFSEKPDVIKNTTEVRIKSSHAPK